MRDLLLLCTKNVHFSYNNGIYIQTEGVAMALTLDLVLAFIFMVELKRTIFSILREQMSAWKRHVDDTISYIKEKYFEHVLSEPNGYHANIRFTYEKKGRQATFLRCVCNT